MALRTTRASPWRARRRRSGPCSSRRPSRSSAVHPGLAKAIGIAAALATALLARRLASTWTGMPALGLLAGVRDRARRAACLGRLSGMEVALAALLVTAALLAHTAEREWPTALLLGLAALARPESILLVPLVWLARPVTLRRTIIALRPRGRGAGARRWHSTSSRPARRWPATASAKIEGGLVGLLVARASPSPLRSRGGRGSSRPSGPRLSGGPMCCCRCCSCRGSGSCGAGSARLALPAAALLLQPLGMALLAPYRGPAFQEGRYAAHLLPLAIAAAVMALIPLAERPRLGRAAAAARYHRRTRGAARRGPALRLGRAEHRCHAGPSGTLGGALTLRAKRGSGSMTSAPSPIVSRREVVDLMGLVTPAIIPYRRDGEAGVLRYLERACPDYLIIFPAWFPASLAPSRTGSCRSTACASSTIRWPEPTRWWSTRLPGTAGALSPVHAPSVPVGDGLAKDFPAQVLKSYNVWSMLRRAARSLRRTEMGTMA